MYISSQNAHGGSIIGTCIDYQEKIREKKGWKVEIPLWISIEIKPKYSLTKTSAKKTSNLIYFIMYNLSNWALYWICKMFIFLNFVLLFIFLIYACSIHKCKYASPWIAGPDLIEIWTYHDFSQSKLSACRV
jgi:hypothetical protein